MKDRLIWFLIGFLATFAIGFAWPYRIGKMESDAEWKKRLSDAGYEYRETIIKK